VVAIVGDGDGRRLGLAAALALGGVVAVHVWRARVSWRWEEKVVQRGSDETGRVCVGLGRYIARSGSNLEVEHECCCAFVWDYVFWPAFA
jgi:hypothetical protein